MNSGFYPNVLGIRTPIQTQSLAFQTPFYFGGSQVPINLGLETNKIKSSKTTKKVYYNKGQIKPLITKK